LRRPGSDNLTTPASLVYAYRLEPLEPNFSAFSGATGTNYSDLPNGTYIFHVTATDASGNVDASGAVRTFTVDVPPPSPPPPPAPPSVTVVVKGCSTCRVGDFAKVNLSIVNPGGARTVEMKVFSRFPEGSTILNFIDRHHEEVLPAGASFEFDIPRITLPSGLPFGTYTIEAALWPRAPGELPDRVGPEPEALGAGADPTGPAHVTTPALIVDHLEARCGAGADRARTPAIGLSIAQGK
jgi:hypothetical protein